MKLPMRFLLFLLAATTVTATGIGVAPAELNFNIEKGKSQQRELTVYNLDDKEIEFEVKSNAGFLEFYHSGIMEAAGEEKIIVEASAASLKEGTYKESIYITSSGGAHGVRLSIGTAVKASVNVFNAKKTNTLTGIITSASIVLFGLLVYFIAIRKSLIVKLSRRALLAVKP